MADPVAAPNDVLELVGNVNPGGVSIRLSVLQNTPRAIPVDVTGETHGAEGEQNITVEWDLLGHWSARKVWVDATIGYSYVGDAPDDPEIAFAPYNLRRVTPGQCPEAGYQQLYAFDCSLVEGKGVWLQSRSVNYQVGGAVLVAGNPPAAVGANNNPPGQPQTVVPPWPAAFDVYDTAGGQRQAQGNLLAVGAPQAAGAGGDVNPFKAAAGANFQERAAAAQAAQNAAAFAAQIAAANAAAEGGPTLFDQAGFTPFPFPILPVLAPAKPPAGGPPVGAWPNTTNPADGTARYRVIYKKRPYIVRTDVETAQLAQNYPGLPPELLRYVERTSHQALQSQPLPQGTLVWDVANGAPAGLPPIPDNAAYRLVPTRSLRYVWHDVPFLNIVTWDLCLGRVNAAPFDGGPGWPTYAAQTLLMQPYQYTLKQQINGSWCWTITFEFLFRRETWNKLLSPDGNYYPILMNWNSPATIANNAALAAAVAAAEAARKNLNQQLLIAIAATAIGVPLPNLWFNVVAAYRASRAADAAVPVARAAAAKVFATAPLYAPIDFNQLFDVVNQTVLQ